MNVVRKYLLLLIILLAAFLRFYSLGQNPPSLTWDEVAWGYNAYSLGIDGKDEFGRFLPLDYIESFGDFKPPLYAYIDVIPIKIFGLNEFAVRFPSALLGTLTVLITYFLVRLMFVSRELSRISTRINANALAFISTFILAISPWHINLSRAAFEANVATFFIILGVFLFLRAISRGGASITPRRWNRIDTSGVFLVLSVVSFAFSMYTFNTARVVAPLLVVILSLGFGKRLWEMKKGVVIAFVVGAFVMLPLLNFLLYPQASLRFREVNIFSDIVVIRKTNQQMANDGNTWWTNIIHNRRFAYTAEYLKHYFDHFKSGFLFINGDGNPKFSSQDVGSLYLWDLPFFIIGILFIFRQRIGYWWIVPLWMIIGIAPAATARETPHVLRIESALPTFQILTAYGVLVFVIGVSKISSEGRFRFARQIKYLIFALTILFLIFNFSYYLHGYYSHYAREYSGEWQYGYKEAIAFTKNEEENFDEIIFTTHLGRPYIYYLFYTKTESEVFRKDSNVERDAFGFVNVKRVGKNFYEKDLNTEENKDKKILYVDVPVNVPENANVVKTFYLLNGKPSLVAFTI